MQREELEHLLNFILSIPGVDEFLDEHPELKDFGSILNEFEKAHGSDLGDEERLKLKIAKERNALIVDESPNALCYINESLQVDDSEILTEFSKDLHKAKTGRFRFERAEIQHYKTITEKIARQEVDFDKEAILKYKDCTHPYVCSYIAQALLNSKQFEIGLDFLFRGLKNVFGYPNVYWHNTWGLYGSIDALYELQHLLGREGMSKLSESFGGYHFILELLYLYISRGCYLYDSRIPTESPDVDNIPIEITNKINYLSLRADLVYFYQQEFLSIFPLGTNPLIQVMSDKATSFGVADRYGLALIAKDHWKDALKLYQHGSLIPNYTGGILEQEDATFPELIERGQLRGRKVAHELYKKYKQCSYTVTNDSLAKCYEYLYKKFEK